MEALMQRYKSLAQLLRYRRHLLIFSKSFTTRRSNKHMTDKEQTRRQAFVKQVRKVLGPKLGDLSQKQKDLLDRGLTEIFAENRPVTDAELAGQLELVELAAPRELKAA